MTGLVVGVSLVAVSATISFASILGVCISMLVSLGSVLLRNLSKSATAGWDAYDRVRREKNTTIHHLQWEVAVWQARALGSIEPPYVEPSDKELNA